MKRVIYALLVCGSFALAQSAYAQSQQSYSYDAYGRLVGVADATNGQNINTNYNYDNADNRTGLVTSGAPGGQMMARTAPQSSAQSTSAQPARSSAQNMSGFTPAQQAIVAACVASDPKYPSPDCRP